MRMFQHVSAQKVITLAEEKRHPLDHIILEYCHFHNLMLSSHPEFKYHIQGYNNNVFGITGQGSKEINHNTYKSLLVQCSLQS